MNSDRSDGGTAQCESGTEQLVCGGDEQDHHLCVATETVFGGTVWVYDDGYARVVPDWTGHTVGGESA